MGFEIGANALTLLYFPGFRRKSVKAPCPPILSKFKNTMGTHRVTSDRHPTRIDWEFRGYKLGKFLRNIGVHLIIFIPPRLRSINIKPSTSTEIPRLILPLNLCPS